MGNQKHQQSGDPVAVMEPVRPLYCPLCRGPVLVTDMRPVTGVDHFGDGGDPDRVATRFLFECRACPALYESQAVVAWG